MSNTSKAQNSNTFSGWDEAIAAVETELDKMQKYVIRLKAAKGVFLDAKSRGTIWPGSVEAMMDRVKDRVADKNKSPRQKARAVA